MIYDNTITPAALIAEALPKAISYEEYRSLVSNLLTEDLSTGPVQSDSLLHYSQLNDRRMRRWDKTVELDEEVAKRLRSFNGDIAWLVLTEGWCGDAAHALPVMHKMSLLNEGIQLKLLLRDENLDLMDAFLTNGGRSIPKLIVLDTTTVEPLHTWGPRPGVVAEWIAEEKNKHGHLTEAFKTELQKWYNKDKGRTIANDLVALL